MTNQPNPDGKAVLQKWVCRLPFMQQTVILSSIRGPDGAGKYSKVKPLLRWFRRCVLVSSLDGCVLSDPFDRRGGSFMGSSFPMSDEFREDMGRLSDESREQIFHTVARDEKIRLLKPLVNAYMVSLDELPLHCHVHMLSSAEVLGYKHPSPWIGEFWLSFYRDLANDMHLEIEPR